LLKARHPEDFGLQQPADAPANFRQWIERYFGDGIAKHFMIPYNEKLLGVSLEKLRPEYAERFIPRPSLEEVIKGALGFSRESLGYNARFVYPREGGISALPRSLAANLKIPPSYNLSVTKINLQAHTALLSDGREIRYDRLLNTSPLPRFLSLISDATAEIRSLSGQLRASTVHYFDIGVRGAGDIASGYHWIYFPEPEFIFYRSGSYSAVHADAAPPGCRSYYVEMSGGAADWLARPEELKKRVLADLRKARVLSDDDEILFMELSEIPFAYVIFDQNYESSRKNIFEFLARHDVISAGRWGGWNYGGMEDALLEGKAAADQMNAEAFS